jgi:hypothetical protein
MIAFSLQGTARRLAQAVAAAPPVSFKIFRLLIMSPPVSCLPLNPRPYVPT